MNTAERHAHLISVVILCTVACNAAAWSLFQRDLNDIQKDIVKKYRHVQHIDSARFDNLLRNEILLIDVREQDEYSVSHIKDAVRVSPNIEEQDFIAAFAARAKGKNVILYCSVGYRSSELAERVQEELKAAGAVGVYNLERGIFGQRNDGKSLVNQHGQTDYIHPYNDYWGRLLKRSEQQVYSLERKAE